MSSDVERLSQALRDERDLVLVLTGAGISAASGLATFRGTDPNAIWNLDVREVATWQHFHRRPLESWIWFRRHFARLPLAQPNPAHSALAALEKWRCNQDQGFLLVTQNIDTLHERAGSNRLVKVHGSWDRVRCSRDWCRFGTRETLPIADVDFERFDRAPGPETLPRCPECGSVVRPHALLFDEMYVSHPDYQWELVEDATERMRLLLCVGTSFSVGVTDYVLRAAIRRAVPVFVVDPREPSGREASVSTHLRGQAEIVLPAVCESLAIDQG
jgi:NAD-dependent protein deacetylase/lipoamidase